MSKQSSIDWYIEQNWNLTTQFERQQISQDEYSVAYNNLLQQAKAMHKEEIVDAYDRKVINKKQNWFIQNGAYYYELHYEGKSGVNEYKSDKEDQVGESGRGGRSLYLRGNKLM